MKKAKRLAEPKDAQQVWYTHLIQRPTLISWHANPEYGMGTGRDGSRMQVIWLFCRAATEVSFDGLSREGGIMLVSHRGLEMPGWWGYQWWLMTGFCGVGNIVRMRVPAGELACKRVCRRSVVRKRDQKCLELSRCGSRFTVLGVTPGRVRPRNMTMLNWCKDWPSQDMCMSDGRFVAA